MELEKAIMCTIGVCIFGSETNLLRDANRDGFGKESGIADWCVSLYYFSTFVSAYNLINF